MLNRKETDENGGHLAPFRELIKAYKDCAKEYAKEFPKIELWEWVGEMQKRLPVYGLQEFCDDKAFDPLPLFNTEPKRSCLFIDGNPLQLDRIGLGKKFAFFKGDEQGHGPRGLGSHLAIRFAGHDFGGEFHFFDELAFEHFCGVRTQELLFIIHGLLDDPKNSVGKTSSSLSLD